MSTQIVTQYVADPMRYPSTFMPQNKSSVILDLEAVDDDVYQSVQRKTSVRRKHSMNKGFVMGHGIQAVNKDVGDEFSVSSIHGIFIGSVSNQKPIAYYLERLQNSNGCVARNVEGRQDGRIVFTGIASLTKVSTC
jgi:acyl-CoA thioesterase II